MSYNAVSDRNSSAFSRLQLFGEKEGGKPVGVAVVIDCIIIDYQN